MASKPVDYFDVGQLGLLSDLCETQQLLERCRVDLRRLDIGSEASDRLFNRSMKLGGRLSTLARQLRLTVQWTVDRKAAKSGEGAPEVEFDRLLGGRSLKVVDAAD